MSTRREARFENRKSLDYHRDRTEEHAPLSVMSSPILDSLLLPQHGREVRRRVNDAHRGRSAGNLRRSVARRVKPLHVDARFEVVADVSAAHVDRRCQRNRQELRRL